jgi:serine protease Do
MKNFRTSYIAGLGVLFLTLGAAPGALPGQNSQQSNPQQDTSKPASPAASPKAPAGDTDLKCDALKAATEQLREQLNGDMRINGQVDGQVNEQELQQKLAALQERLAKEAVMSSPELAKLQNLSAQIAGRQGLFEADAQELATRAQELAAEVQENSQEKVSPLFNQQQDFVISGDNNGGWLGVEIGEVTPDNAKDFKLSAVRGVVVKDVEPDSPAAKAGLKENDVITQYDGQSVEGTVQFRRLVRETPPGHTIALAVSHDGAMENLNIELGQRGAFFEKKMQGKMRDFGGVQSFVMPNNDFSFSGPEAFTLMDSRTPVLGINAEDLSGQLGAYFGAPDDSGILVREVRPGTAAEKAGLKAGDVIVQLDGKPVRTLSDLREQLRGKNDQKTASLGILRKGAPMNVGIAIEKPRPTESIQMLHRAQL